MGVAEETRERGSFRRVPWRQTSAASGIGRADWRLIVLLWGIVTVANLFKPFHIDDTAHLEIARWIATDPLRPMSGLLNWSGTLEPILETNQPHLFFYLLAGWSELFGFGEVSLHLFQSVFAFAAIALFHSIARARVPRIAGWLTAMLALGPAFVVEQNVMVDVALLAVWLAFFRFLLLGIGSERQVARYTAMASFASAALLIKYSSVVLVAVLVLCLVLERRRSLAWVLLIPAGTLLLWSAFNIYDVGSAHLLSLSQAGPSTGAFESAYLWVVTLGGLLPLGAMIATYVSGRRVRRRVWLGALLATVALVAAVLVGIVADTVADRVLLVVFLANGTVMVGWLGLMLARAVRPGLPRLDDPARLERGYLLAWIVTTTAFYVVLSPFVASRHLLLVLPPILLLFGMAFRDIASRRSLAAGLAVTVVVSLGLTVSDWRFASYYRSAATDVASKIPDGARVWTSGHWGWQWYAQQQGMVQLDVKKNDVRPGDYWVVAEDVTQETAPDLGPLVRVRQIPGGTDPASLLCTGRPARLYLTSGFGPWSLSRNCTGDIAVYRVVDRSGSS